MFYPYAKIDHIDQVREAIKGKEEIKEIKGDGYIVFSYAVVFPDTFPNVTTEQEAILRECRGITFYEDTGEVAIRPFEKFFNVNEREDTLSNVVDLSIPHTILMKLDGSMVTPFVRRDGEIQWHTKRGKTEYSSMIKDTVNNSSVDYDRFIRMHHNLGSTPIFEWMTRKNMIVIDYGSQEQLVLTAIRDNWSGEYVKYDEMVKVAKAYEIPYVKQYPGSLNNIDQLLKETKDLINAEGWIIRYNNGHMLKVKGEWYVSIHKAKASLRFEKDVINLILTGKEDDVKAHLLPMERERLELYSRDLSSGMKSFAKMLDDFITGEKSKLIDIPEKDRRKVFAMKHMPKADKRIQGLVMGIYNGKNSFEEVQKFVLRKSTSSTKVESIRDLIGGINWLDS